MFSFEILHTSKKSRARVGRIHTPHGIIETPHFVAVGTNGTMKAIDSQMLTSLDIQLMFCNTYHLMLQPGTKLIAQAGGLHKFMNRSLPLITDSGGFQILSLRYGSVIESHDELKRKNAHEKSSLVLKVSEEGVLFRSYRNGDHVLLTPETAVEAQKELGADIIIPLDELLPFHVPESSLEQSLERTHRWEKRSLHTHLQNRQQQAMYSVVHGGLNPDFRKRSAQFLATLAFDGHAIGGSFGKTRQEMCTMLAHTLSFLPSEKPIHLLGIGDLASIEPIIGLGIDTFDSSYPTKCARHGLLFTFEGTKKATHASFRTQFGPIENECECFTCTHYTAAYVYHLFKAHELIAYTLATIHNLYHMVKRMKQYRQAIMDDRL
jgi:queuine tRNA-ribosyltransferase